MSSVATSTLSCTHGGVTYSVGSSDIQRSVCERCHCLANSLYAPARELTCYAVHCPVPDCPSPSVPAGECCPRCPGYCEKNIEITNCPSDAVRLSLPSSRDEVLYHFSPTTRDCNDEGRRITTTQTPQGDIYTWNGANGHLVEVTATAAGTSDSVTCSFKVIPVGKSSIISVILQLLTIFPFVYHLMNIDEY